MDPRQRLIAAFPVSAGSVSLELVESGEEGGQLALLVRLGVWEGEGEARTIVDMKEQRVRIGDEALGDPRLEAYVEGWRMALLEVFRAAAVCSYEEGVCAALPSDLVDLRALRLKRPKTAEEFCDALLQRSRLGAFLPSA